MKVLYVTSEAAPFAATGGLADVAGSLPKALRAKSVGMRVVLPLYECVAPEWRDQMEFVTSISVPVSWRRQYCGVFQLKRDNVIYYFLDNEYYFKRQGLYGHYDDAERFAFLSRAALEVTKAVGYKPDILHANDWQTALVPIYHSLYYVHDPFYYGMKTVFTIHNIAYQGQYGMETLGDVFGIGGNDRDVVEYGGCVNLMKGAIECADRVTTVSPTYAGEIMDTWFSRGLHDILRPRAFKIFGILNGIDVTSYNPETDPALAANYSAKKPDGKAACKEALQKELGLPVRSDVPVVTMVTRLVAQKGLDLVKYSLDKLLSTADLQLVVLGTGDYAYEEYFKRAQARYPQKLCYYQGFNPALARRMYAGADIFLMPSQFEPCGLSQMIACRYGTVAVVRETGGLKDSIRDCGDGFGNGFTFATYNADDMLGALYRALGAYQNKADWTLLRDRAFGSDFSWKPSAEAYKSLYKSLLDKA